MKAPKAQIAACADDSCEYLVNPIPRPRVQSLQVQRRSAVARVAFVDSRKPNSIAILRQAGALLAARGVEVRSEIFIKPDPSRPLDEPTLDWIAREEGLILCGVAD